MSEPTQRQRAVRGMAGASARGAGAARSSNPHDPRTDPESYQAWAAGWLHQDKRIREEQRGSRADVLARAMIQIGDRSCQVTHGGPARKSRRQMTVDERVDRIAEGVRRDLADKEWTEQERGEP